MKRLNASYFVFKYSDKYRFPRTFQDFVWFQCLRYMTVTIFILTMIANEMGYKRIKQQIKINSCERFWIILFKVYLIKWGLLNYEINTGYTLQFSHFIPAETYLDVSYWFIVDARACTHFYHKMFSTESWNWKTMKRTK